MLNIPLYQVCVLESVYHKDDHRGLWSFAYICSTSPMQHNWTKLDRKYVLNILYWVCFLFFMPICPQRYSYHFLWLDIHDTFSTSLQPLNRFWQNLIGRKYWTSLPSFFRVDLTTKMTALDIEINRWHLCKQGRIQNLHCRGHKWPMKPKAALRREAPKGGGWGRGLPPPAGGGPGGLPRNFVWEIASKWCILSAFWGNQYTFFCTENLSEKNASH